MAVVREGGTGHFCSGDSQSKSDTETSTTNCSRPLADKPEGVNEQTNRKPQHLVMDAVREGPSVPGEPRG